FRRIFAASNRSESQDVARTVMRCRTQDLLYELFTHPLNPPTCPYVYMGRRTTKMKPTLLNKVLMASALALGVAAAATTGTATPASDDAIAKRLVHEVRMYPRYTIWDNINLRVQDGNVELMGQVSQPFKKDDLAR